MFFFHRRLLFLHGRLFLLHGRLFLLHGRLFLLYGRLFLLYGRLLFLHRRLFLLHGRQLLLHGRRYFLYRRLFLFHSSCRNPAQEVVGMALLPAGIYAYPLRCLEHLLRVFVEQIIARLGVDVLARRTDLAVAAPGTHMVLRVLRESGCVQAVAHFTVDVLLRLTYELIHAVQSGVRAVSSLLGGGSELNQPQAHGQGQEQSKPAFAQVFPKSHCNSSFLCKYIVRMQSYPAAGLA
ncbi:MAG: hypothetical protein HFF77_09160 [Oscillospiraceae bacterium]|nr:hypothetical protein [Oscillospiraceae bacterium]